MGLKQSKADSQQNGAPQPLIIENSPAIDFSKTVILEPQRYNNTTRNWEKITTNNVDIKQNTLKFVTYNVWFETEVIDRRMPALFQLLEQENADVICLQEVLPRFIKALCEQPWVRNNYVVSDCLGFTCMSYGVAILTKVPSVTQMKLIPTDSGMGRKLLELEFRINQAKVKVGTLHFESLNHRDLRRDQLILSCNELTTECTHTFLLGDFNFGEQHTEEEKSLSEIALDKGWKDTWKVLKPDDPGNTIDVNYPHPYWKPARFDRVLVKSDCWVPSSVHLIGDHSLGLSESGNKIFPSDHIGLVAEFVWKDSSNSNV